MVQTKALIKHFLRLREARALEERRIADRRANGLKVYPVQIQLINQLSSEIERVRLEIRELDF